MRRFFGAVLVCSSLALIGAVPSPAPKAATPARATASPSPSAAPVISAEPAVLVYPFDTPTDVKADIGLNVAQIFQQVFLNSANLRMLAVGQGVKRSDYQTYAQSHHADYYVAGYIQPIGQTAAVVAQLVSVQSGSTVYSQTQQITSVQDVASEALTFDSAIQSIEHPDVSIQSSSDNATPAPEATSGGASMKLGGLSGLFKGKGHTVQATPMPVADKPARGIFVTRVTGTATSSDLANATNTLLASLNIRYNARLSQDPSANVSASADAICGTHRDNTVTAETLNTHREGRGAGHDVYDFTFTVYTCFGSQLFTTSTSDRDYIKAVNDAVDAYAKQSPQNS